MHELEAILHEYLSFNWDRMEEVNKANAHLQRDSGLMCPWRPSGSQEESQVCCAFLCTVRRAAPAILHLQQSVRWCKGIKALTHSSHVCRFKPCGLVSDSCHCCTKPWQCKLAAHMQPVSVRCMLLPSDNCPLYDGPVNTQLRKVGQTHVFAKCLVLIHSGTKAKDLCIHLYPLLLMAASPVSNSHDHHCPLRSVVAQTTSSQLFCIAPPPLHHHGAMLVQTCLSRPSMFLTACSC